MSNTEFWRNALGDRFSEFKRAAESGLFPTMERPLSIRNGSTNTVATLKKPVRRYGEYGIFMGVT